MKKIVTIEIRPLAWLSIAAFVAIAAGAGYFTGRQTQDATGDADRIGAYLTEHPEAVERIVGNYMRTHPEALTEMFAGLLRTKKEAAALPPQNFSAAITSNADAIFSSPHQVTLGNPEGDVTLVQFLDYNCGFCKRALADTMSLLERDPKLRIVVKEYPILGQNSIEAARVAIALRMQDPDGVKYLAFHRDLLGGHGPADRRRALDVARLAGADMTRLERDAASKEVSDTLEETTRLGTAMGIDGTPSYIVGNEVLAGAVGAITLGNSIRLARAENSTSSAN